MENQAKTETTEEQKAQPKDKAQRILDMKLRALNNNDSIFILPFGTEGFKMAHMVRSTDKLVSHIKRKFGTEIDIKQAKEIFKDLEAFAGTLWEFVYKISPNLHNLEPRDWRRVNDPAENKKAIAHRKSSIVVEPRSEESARIAMAVKIIQQKNIELRNTSSFEDLEKFVKEYVSKLTAFDSLLASVSGKLGQEYKSFVD